MVIALPQRKPWYTPRRILRAASSVRRYPVISVTTLFIVLIIPAIFAPLVAPHDPLQGILSDRLIPPFWVAEESTVLTVVDTPQDDLTEIAVFGLQGKLDSGKATLVVGGEDGKPDPGDRVKVITTPAGSSKYILGTDKVGRDILSRIIYGSRVSIIIASIAILVSGLLGATLGIVSGYFGGWSDSLIMRTVDISLAIPIILLALVLVAAVGPSYHVVIWTMVVTLWARYARMARGETLSVRGQDYVSRAKVAGASNIRIMVHHIFPNVFNSMIVLATLQVGFVIVLEATLSFLGAGIPRPTPAWGLMVSDGRELVVTAWWVAFFPGLAIMLVCLTMNTLGDWLRDRLDPKQRQV